MITKVLALIGLFTLIAILAGVIVIAEWEIEKLIKNKKREYQVKHRFDKPPKAKCYCVDCVYYEPYEVEGSTMGKCCFNSNRGFNDNHFCAMAEPAKNSRR